MFGLQTKIFAVITVVMIAVMGFMYYQNSQLQSKVELQENQIGSLTHVIKERNEVIRQIDAENKKLVKTNETTNKILAENRDKLNKLQSDDKKHRREIDRLKAENHEIKTYLDTDIDHQLVRMFWLPECGADSSEEAGLCRTAGGTVAGNTEARYPTQELINYTLDLQAGFNSCESDKASLRDWVSSIQ